MTKVTAKGKNLICGCWGRKQKRVEMLTSQLSLVTPTKLRRKADRDDFEKMIENIITYFPVNTKFLKNSCGSE